MDNTDKAIASKEYEANHSVSFVPPPSFTHNKQEGGKCASSSSTVTMTNVSGTTSGQSAPVSRTSSHDDIEKNLYASVGSETLIGHECNNNDSNITIHGRESQVSLPESGLIKWYPPPLPNSDLYLVNFNGPDDPIHAQNWPLKRKLLTTMMLGYTTFTSVFTSSIYSTISSSIARQYKVPHEVGTLGLSLYILGFAFGPIFWAPISELKGRRSILVWSMLGFSIFQIGTAVAKDLQTIILCRFWGGIFGAAPLAVVGAVFVDIYDNRTRGIAIAVMCIVVFTGPPLAPFIGGFITDSSFGWRCTQWLAAIMGFTSFFINMLFLEESFAPAILVAKAVKLRRETHNWAIHAKQEELEVDVWELFTNYFSRPIRMLFKEAIILLISIYMSFIYGLLYMFLTAYSMVFQGIHGMSAGISGLTYFGMIFGMILAGLFVTLAQPSYSRKLAANNGINIPEWRLPPMVIGSFSFAMGILWFAWSGYKLSIHWIVPTLAGIPIGFGLILIFIQSLNYLIDSYIMFAASALAANALLRYFAGAAFPLFARILFNSLGINWGCTVLGVVATVCVPIPIIFYYYGHSIRALSSFNQPTSK